MTEPPSWPAPSGDQPPPPPAWGQPGQPPTPPPGYGSAPQYGQPQYGQPQDGQPQYGQQYGQPQYAGYPQQPPFQQPYAQAAPKPGIIPLRPLAVSEVLDGAFATIRRHPKATLGLSAVVACVQQALILLVRWSAGNLTSATGLFSRNGNTDAGELGTVYGSLGTTLLISAVLGALLTGVLCLVVSDSILGQPSSAGSAWQRARPMAWRLLGVSLLAGIGQVAALVLCVLPGMFLWGAWALAVPALVLERTTVIGALRRSWRLAVPSFWRVWGIRALGWLVATIITGVLTSVTGASEFLQAFQNAGNGDVTVHISTLTIVLTSIASVIGYTVTAPFLAGLVTLLYVDRRIRAEALDVQLQQAAATGPAVPGAAPPF